MSSKLAKQGIVIGICTRQRNALLRRLLESIWEQPIPPSYNVEILIIDNDDQPAVTPEIIALPDKFKLTLLHEPKPGLVNARNRVLDFATTANADWLIGVDDDEWVSPHWLEQYIVAFETLNTEIIVAAKHIVYAKKMSPFVEQRQIVEPPAGAPSQILSTANYAISKRVFHSDYGPGLRFAMQFNESGGEDYEFMLRAKNQYELTARYWPYAIASEECAGRRTAFKHHFERRVAAQVTRYRATALHRKTLGDGSSFAATLNLLKRTNRAAVYGTGWCLLGVGLVLIGRKNGRVVIGKGLFAFARAYAIVPYLMGTRTLLYGANVNADRSV